MNQHANNPEKKALAGFASIAVIQSVVFNPPPPCHSNSSSPYKHTCNARFFIHQYGPNPGSFNISVVEMKGRENITTTLWWSSKSLGDKWTRVEVVLPNITSKYFMQVESRMGIRIYSDVAFDDFSMSPECFGYNIPAEHLGNYNYWDPRIGIYKKPYVDFIDKKCELYFFLIIISKSITLHFDHSRLVYELSTCGAHGNYGPTPDDCMKAYNGSDYTNHIRVSEKLPYKGVQIWKVPSEGYYT
jgi:anaplastic lymphoma kinase